MSDVAIPQRRPKRKSSAAALPSAKQQNKFIKLVTTLFVVASSPLRLAVWLCEAVVSASVVAVLASIAGWWFGIVTDQEVASLLGRIGERLLSILSHAGVLQ